MRSVITGTGIGIPKNVVPNEKLSKIMDTSDEWIRTRTGIEQRHYVDPGQGSLELGMTAADNAMKAAKVEKTDIDAVIFATMTPNYFFQAMAPCCRRAWAFPSCRPSTSGSSAPGFSTPSTSPTH